MSDQTPDDGGPAIVLNIAGEGEVPHAIDINSLVFPFDSTLKWIRPGLFIQGDMTELPVRAAVATEVVGQKLPMMRDDEARPKVVAEAFRVLIPGGVVRLQASSGGGVPWLPHLVAAGFVGSTIEGAYAVGVKPL